VRRGISCLVIALLAAVLSGCWDQQLLKNVRIVSIGGWDLTDKGELRGTISIVDAKKSDSGTSDRNEIHSVKAKTPRNGSDILNHEISDTLAFNKMYVQLIGERMAKKGIYPAAQVYYREAKTAITARLAVVRGTAQDVIEMKKAGNRLIGEHIYKLLKATEEMTMVPKENLQTILPELLDPGQDFALPYLQKSGNKVLVGGLAMFHNDRMTGTLSANDSILYLLLDGKKGKKTDLTLKVNQHAKEAMMADYITINVKKLKRKIKVSTGKDRQIQVNLSLQLPVTAIEYAKDLLKEKPVIEKLNRILSMELTRQANKVIGNMQKAGHDGFGIGRRVMAFYPDTWKQLDWEKTYPQVMFNTRVDVKIVGHGIMN